jgi:hypothetical protein
MKAQYCVVFVHLCASDREGDALGDLALSGPEGVLQVREEACDILRQPRQKVSVGESCFASFSKCRPRFGCVLTRTEIQTQSEPSNTLIRQAPWSYLMH